MAAATVEAATVEVVVVVAAAPKLTLTIWPDNNGKLPRDCSAHIHTHTHKLEAR